MICVRYLVVDEVLGRPVHVFLTEPPGFQSHRVVLRRLAGEAPSPVVGQSAVYARSYVEFPTRSAAAAAGYTPLAAARVCASWGEYLEPYPLDLADPVPAADPKAKTVRVAATELVRR